MDILYAFSGLLSAVPTWRAPTAASLERHHETFIHQIQGRLQGALSVKIAPNLAKSSYFFSEARKMARPGNIRAARPCDELAL